MHFQRLGNIDLAVKIYNIFELTIKIEDKILFEIYKVLLMFKHCY